MSKRNKKGQFAPKRSPAMVGVAWFSSLASLSLLYISGKAVMSDLSAFGSCDRNNGLKVVSCGKHSLNIGDLMLIALFMLSAGLVVTLFTAAWRMSRRVAG